MSIVESLSLLIYGIFYHQAIYMWQSLHAWYISEYESVACSVLGLSLVWAIDWEFVGFLCFMQCVGRVLTLVGLFEFSVESTVLFYVLFVIWCVFVCAGCVPFASIVSFRVACISSIVAYQLLVGLWSFVAIVLSVLLSLCRISTILQFVIRVFLSLFITAETGSIGFRRALIVRLQSCSFPSVGFVSARRHPVERV